MVVYTLQQRWEVGLRSTNRRCRFWQKKISLFRWSSCWSWLVCKQAKLSYLGYRKPSCIHWKSDARKTSHCLVRILVQRHNLEIFLRKYARRGHYSQWRSLLGHVERIFVHRNWKAEYWQHLISTGRHYVPHSRSCTRCFAPCFWRWHYQPRKCDLTPLDYYLWGADKDKPQTIDGLKDNICEAIGEIQLHTIDNVLKN